MPTHSSWTKNKQKEPKSKPSSNKKKRTKSHRRNKVKPRSAHSSRYNGVSKIAKVGKFSSHFSNYSLGRYVLETDAALAYDSIIRASGRKNHYAKINFATAQEYTDAREREMKIRGLATIGLADTLSLVTSKVNQIKARMTKWGYIK